MRAQGNELCHRSHSSLIMVIITKHSFVPRKFLETTTKNIWTQIRKGHAVEWTTEYRHTSQTFKLSPQPQPLISVGVTTLSWLSLASFSPTVPSPLIHFLLLLYPWFSEMTQHVSQPVTLSCYISCLGSLFFTVYWPTFIVCHRLVNSVVIRYMRECQFCK